MGIEYSPFPMIKNRSGTKLLLIRRHQEKTRTIHMALSTLSLSLFIYLYFGPSANITITVERINFIKRKHLTNASSVRVCGKSRLSINRAHQKGSSSTQVYDVCVCASYMTSHNTHALQKPNLRSPMNFISAPSVCMYIYSYKCVCNICAASG